MRKIFYSIILAMMFLAPMASVSAIDLGIGRAGKAAEKAGYADADTLTLAETIGTVIKTALSFVGVIFLFLMVYAGYLLEKQGVQLII